MCLCRKKRQANKASGVAADSTEQLQMEVDKRRVTSSAMVGGRMTGETRPAVI